MGESKKEKEKEDLSLMNKEELYKVEKKDPIDSMKTKDQVVESTSSKLEDENKQIPLDVVNEKEESLKKEETSLTQINISDDIKDKDNSTLHHKLEVGDPVDMQKKTLDHVSKSDKSIEKAEDKKEESTKDMDQSNLEAKLNEEKSSKDMEDLTKIKDIKENVSEGISQGEEISNNKVNEENDIRNESEKDSSDEKDERNEQATESSDEGCKDSNARESKREIDNKVTELQNQTEVCDKRDYENVDVAASNNDLESKKEKEKEDLSSLTKEELFKVEKKDPIDSMKTKDLVVESTSSKLEDENKQIPSDVVNEK